MLDFTIMNPSIKCDIKCDQLANDEAEELVFKCCSASYMMKLFLVMFPSKTKIFSSCEGSFLSVF